MEKRSHANTKRLTARERARDVYDLIAHDVHTPAEGVKVIQDALQAHARETLDRAKRRAKDDPNHAPCTTKGTTRVSCTCHRFVKGKWVSTEANRGK